MKYDVFISYRRDGCLDLARSICYYLRSKGVRCFFDLKEINEGKFDEAIYEALNGSKYFLLLLARGSLDRCANAGDWVRLEIEYAMSLKDRRHEIIPVVVDGREFEFPSSIPESFSDIKTIQQATLDRGHHFERDIDDLLVNRMPRLGRKIGKKIERQARRREADAERAFCDRARRFKDEELIRIDIGGGHQKLMRYAGDLGLDQQRAEILIEDVNNSVNGDRRRAQWVRAHPMLTAFAIAAAFIAVSLLIYGLLPSETRCRIDTSYLEPTVALLKEAWGRLCDFASALRR